MTEERPILTTRQGHPVRDNQSMRTVGERGPATLENYQFIEKITHFDRERIPERVVHARGTGAHGWFEAYGKIGDEPASKYTRAKVLNETGVRTPMFVRFSTVIGRQGQPGDGARPARLRGEVLYGGRQLGPGRQQPESLLHPGRHQVSGHDPRLQAGPGHEPSGGVALLRFRDAPPRSPAHGDVAEEPLGHPGQLPRDGRLGRQHLQARQRAGRRAPGQVPLGPEAGRAQSHLARGRGEIQAKDVGHATRDLYDAIERGEYPEWEFCVQIMSDDDHPELDFDPLDDTKRWPEDQFPLLPVGRMVLDRNPDNFFAEAEQAAFGTGVLVDGIDFSDDKMLQGRTLSYSDTQRYRVGAELPAIADQRAAEVRCAHQPARRPDGLSSSTPAGENPHVNYEPSSMGGLREAPKTAKGLPPVGRRPPRPLPDHPRGRRLQAGRRALPHVRGLGARRPRQQPCRRHESLPGAHRAPDGLALLALR